MTDPASEDKKTASTISTSTTNTPTDVVGAAPTVEIVDVATTTTEETKEREELTTFIGELSQKIKLKSDLRTKNLTCIRPSEEHFVKFDSSLKKNTAFVKKLKQFSASQLETLLKDLSTLNVTKYISEISAALVEAKLKMTDLPAAVQLCSQLHRNYVDFSQTFFENWQKILAIKPTEKIQNASKLRVDLRFFAELISAGIFSNKIGLPLLGTVLTNLISQDKDDYSNLSIILSFCRHCGEEYAGLVPKTILDMSQKYPELQIPKSQLLPSDKQQNLRNLLKDYYVNLSKHLKSEHKTLQSAQRVNRNIMESKGEVSTERREKQELMQANFDKLIASVQTMSDLLNESMPELPKDEEAAKCGIVLDMIDDSADSLLDPWGDEETKNFYVDLPDLRIFLPNYAPKQSSAPPDETAMTEDALDQDIEPGQLDVEETGDGGDDAGDDPPSTSKDDNLEGGGSGGGVAGSGGLNDDGAGGDGDDPLSKKPRWQIFLRNLPNCVNKELIDSAAIEFLLNFNTKNNRKKLVKVLIGTKRTRLDLLPFLSRFVATINLVNTDVASKLCQKLKNEFKYHIVKKDQMNIESKIKIVRFIGEMVKFGLYPKIEALFCLKVLLLDFHHHQIEMTCAFLEVAGQYLYNCKESRFRTNIYLEQMLRLKTANALDSQHVIQIENSYYLVKPPEGFSRVQKVRPPMFSYIRHLIFEELNKSNVDEIIKYMRRLNWDDAEIYNYIVKCMAKAYNIRYHLIRCLADLVSGISSYQDKAVVKVIDTVFEDIRAGLEIHSPKLAQRRVAMANYLGELYNYRLVESSNILNTLYSIISLGVTFDHDVHSEMDPPDSMFRLKLACVLLDTCGQYFRSAVSRTRLDYFLVFFQHYYWFKKSNPIFSNLEENTSNLFPILVDHMYKETLNNVRPKLKHYKSYDQAKEEVEKLRQQLYPNLNADKSETSDLPTNKSTDPNELDTINEDGELTDQTNNDFTEDTTSEAFVESDDEIRVRTNDGSDDETNNPDDEDDGGGGGGGNDDDDDDDEDTENRNVTPDDDDLENMARNKKLEERTQEDIEFEMAFERMAAESYQERIRDTVKVSAKDISVPLLMTKTSGGKKISYDQLQQQQQQQQGTESTETKTTSVPFVLMTRGSKGGKQQFKTFNAPNDSALAINLRLQEQKIREENEKVKRLTLNITERLEEEDYQISLLQSQRPPAETRTQKQIKQRYKHQKGAPDADLIFG